MTGPTGRPVPTRRPVRAGPAIRSVSFARYEESDAGHDRRDALDDGFRVAGLLWCRSLGPVQTARPVLNCVALEAAARQCAPRLSERAQLRQLREAVDVERVTVEDMQDAFERPISGRPVQEIERAAGTDPAFFQDTVIPAGAAGFLNAPGHADCLEALVQPPAGLPGLGDLDPRRAKPVDIADADIGFGQAFGRNVLAERSFRAEVPGKLGRLRFPGGIVIEGVVVDGLFRTAVMLPVTLLVARQARARDLDSAVERPLENAAGDTVLAEWHGLADQDGAYRDSHSGRSFAFDAGAIRQARDQR